MEYKYYVIKRIGFYKIDDIWRINLPQWPGDSSKEIINEISFLESFQTNWVRLDFSNEYFQNSKTLMLISNDIFIEYESGLKFHMCDAMKIIFKDPTVLFYNK